MIQTQTRKPEAVGNWEKPGWPEGVLWWTPLLASGTSRKQMPAALYNCSLGRLIVPEPDPDWRDSGAKCEVVMGLCEVMGNV